MTNTAVNEADVESQLDQQATDKAAQEEPTKTVTPVEELSVLAQALVKSAAEKATEIKTVADKQNSVGDVGKLLSEAIESSENDEVKALRVKRERAAKAMLEMDKRMEEIVKPTLSIPTDEEIAQLDIQYKALASQLNTFNTVFTTEISANYPNLTLFDYVGELPKGRKGAKAGQGTGTSRPRVSSVEVTEDKNGEDGYIKVEKDGKSTFSHLAVWLKGKTGESVSAGDFHGSWTEQNGKSDWTELPEVSKFNFSVTDKEGKTHQFWVRVTK